MTAETPMVVFDKVSLAFDDTVILREISFTVTRGHTKIFLGASGSGKSTILKLMIGLLRPDGGEIRVKGERVDDKSDAELMAVRDDLGMVFQEGALFDSLTVAENVAYKLLDDGMPDQEAWARVDEVLGYMGLESFADRLPSGLSGGPRRRVAIARAMAYKPAILLYDEATTGLDPITADAVNNEIIKLRDVEDVSSIVVTHQLRDAFRVATHEAVREGTQLRIVPASPEKRDEAEFIMLKNGIIHFEGNATELRASTDPYVRSFLS